MAQQPLSRKEALRTLKALKKHEGNRTYAAKELGLPRSTVQNRVEVIATTFPDLEIPFGGHRGGLPKQERTLEENVTHAKTTSEANHAKRQLKEAIAEITKLQDTIADLKWAAGAMASYAPVAWTFPDKRQTKSEHMPYLLTSDFQVGEVVRKEETEHGYGYDVDIFKRRYKHMIKTAIYLARQHCGPGWTYPGFIYARAGDPISGGIHQELRETDSLTPPEAAQVCAETEAQGIKTLADEFGQVFVPCTGHSNHSRITFKPQAKKARANSYDMLIDWMIMKSLAGDKRIKFQMTESPDVFFPIYDMNILLTHGDNMGSRGGQGFIGPLATIMRGAQKTMAEQATIGRRVDRLDHGHFHTPADIGWILSNGSMPGYSEYAKMFRMRPSVPQQWLVFHHPKRGVVDTKRLILTDA